jgi:hypothetical protein
MSTGCEIWAWFSIMQFLRNTYIFQHAKYLRISAGGARTDTSVVCAESVVSFRFDTRWDASTIFDKHSLPFFVMVLRWKLHRIVICDTVYFFTVLKKETTRTLESLRNIQPTTRCHVAEGNNFHPACLIPWKFVHRLSIYYLGRQSDSEANRLNFAISRCEREKGKESWRRLLFMKNGCNDDQ